MQSHSQQSRGSEWRAVRGYDEAMVGRGNDDIDFYVGLQRAGYSFGVLQNHGTCHIPHGTEESPRFHELKDKWQAAAANGVRLQDVNRVINPHGFGDV
ncbi:MAG: hypothetical protein JWM11_4098 [Planctomycetaceae bacterium]|nr:hypothetical protein [Planctomycetaceae bacterium]